MAVLIKALLSAAAALAAAATAAEPLYSAADFATVRKFDAHVHANRADGVFLSVARRDNFELLSINVDYPDFPPLKDQARIVKLLQARDPARFHFATTFTMKGFGMPGWTDTTNHWLDSQFKQGAVAVKVWKNIGMVEKDAAGHFIFLDNPGFDGVMQHIQESGVPLIAHQAEPRNCWLPLDQMTTENDRSYFKDHPEYYMYLHPEMPAYETLMAARDRFVTRHPQLSFVGAHLASLEWSVERLSQFLDAHPNATVDMAARMSNLQAQSRDHYQQVRQFLLKYQDRLLYGSDLTEEPPTAQQRAQNPPQSDDFAAEADTFWRSDWIYLATLDSQYIDAIKGQARGLGLPREVINKIYYSNARRVFSRIKDH